MADMLASIQAAMVKAVDLINTIGTTCDYTTRATSITSQFKVLTKELGTSELVGDFRQGDLKVEMDATKITGVPKKHDTLVIDQLTYTVQSPSGAPRRVGDIVYTYKFVVRGG